MEQLFTFRPGGISPWAGNGVTGQASPYQLNWAVASNGLINLWIDYDTFYYNLGRPPYATCYITGFRAPRSMMTQVDGRWYITEFAPVSRSQF